MLVIFVHGVSERPTAEFENRLKEYSARFDRLVATPLQMTAGSFAPIVWGDLCPAVATESRTSNKLESADPFDIAESVDWRDFVDAKGQVMAAPLLEAALLRSTTIDPATLEQGQQFVALLDEQGVRIAPPLRGQTTSGLLLDMLASQIPPNPHRTCPESPLEKINGNSLVNAIATSLEVTMLPFGVRPRDIVAREMAARWIDIVWYFGAGRGLVRKRVLDRLDHLNAVQPHQPIVVFGHSLGGFVVHDAVNSPEFIRRKLHERGPWCLFLLGAQLKIYDRLGLTENGLRLTPALSGRVRYRNIVDPNDPLGFPLDQPDADVLVSSGANFLAAHNAYLDSDIVMRRVGRELTRIWRELNMPRATSSANGAGSGLARHAAQ